MRIRPLTTEDYRAWRDLMRSVHKLHTDARPDLYRTDFDFTPERLGTLIADPAVDALAAETEDGVVGVAVLMMRPPVGNPVMTPRRVAFLDDIAVDEAHRGRGVGSALLAEARRLARNHGADAFELNVWEFNQRAIAFYEKHGFRTRSRILELPSEAE